MVTTSSVPPNRANTNQGGGETFKCELCDRLPFASQTGLSQHMRQAHPVEYNRGINVDRTKARWSAEEVDMMAREEARVTRDGTAVNINEHLLKLFPKRTLESIKGKRRSANYKSRVQYFTNNSEAGAEAEVRVQSNANVGIVMGGDNDSLKQHIQDLVASLEGNRLKKTRKLVDSARSVLSGTSLEPGTLARWLRSMFIHAKPPRGPSYRSGQVVEAGLSRTKRRRQEYAQIQKLYRRDFGGAVRRVLSSGQNEVIMPPTNEVINFWKRIFESEPVEMGAQANEAYEENAQLRGVWAPISADDIGTCELDLDSAAGPDGITVANWRGVSVKVRALFYNLILINGSLDEELKRARTVLIPKGTGIISPDNTRPLSISSVVVRQLHKILAKRFKTLHSFEPSQRAFIDCDGTMENLSILSTVLADARMGKREVHIATLDQTKAFDSASHTAIIDSITDLGFPKPFIEYVKSLYAESTTSLQYNSTETILKIRQGVLQGDPLSPLLFNAIMDRAIKSIPETVGYRINGVKISIIVYADDIILISSTKEGLQASIDAMTSCLATFGLKTNIGKSSTLSLVPSGKDKKIKVVEEPQFRIDGVTLRAIGVIDTWKYLGVHFTGSKLAKREFCLASDLDKITRAPLKPYQRLRMLCNAIIPKYLHELVLGRGEKGKLKGYDMLIKSFVKRWLYFPKDLPNAYLYAAVNDGGLGIFNLALQVPLIKKSRLQRFLNTENTVAQSLKQSQFIKRQLEWCDKQLAHVGENVTKHRLSCFWRDMLHNMVDTKDLKGARIDDASNSWVANRAHDISGQDYIHYHHIKAGCLPSRARTARGRDERDRFCRAGCRVSETNYHIIQQCQRTHGGRCFRHDRIVDMLYTHFNNRADCKVIREPRFKTSLGLRKPDLLISQHNKTTVLDVQIVSGRSMERDHEQKCSKYRSVPGLDTLIMRKCATSTIEFQACTISFKGLIEKDTSKLLDKLKITKELRHLMVTSVLRGAWLNWLSFNKTTTTTRRYTN